MFTGLVREKGIIEALSQEGGLTRLVLRAPLTSPHLSIGDSLAVNGICLTVTSLAPPSVRVEASVETRRVTTLASWRAGDEVHLEPSLRAGDQIGGHFVLGHVDGTGRVTRTERRDGILRMTVAVAPRLAARLLPKGSVAVDGVSLTLDEGPFREAFTVTLIPHTLKETRFDRMGEGAMVNIEVDVLAKAAAGPDAPGGGAPRRSLTVAAIRKLGWTR